MISEAGIERLIETADMFVVTEMEEGAVLLVNRDGTLPLRETERKVTLFGRAVADPIYKNKSGGPIIDGSPRLLTFHDAFTQADFQVNETLFRAYQESNIRHVKYGRDTVTNSAGSDPSSIGEVPLSFYTDALKGSFAEYSDVAIVLFSREAGEGTDLVADTAFEADGVPQLSLHKEEAELLKMIKDSGAFEKTVVLINSGNMMDLDWVNDYETYGVDACLFVGQPGTTGCAGIVNLLTGQATPSGKLSDTAAMDSLSSPAMRNLGDYEWENIDYLIPRREGTMRSEKYIVYAEGIYVGYKYYESRYYDSVLGQFSADSPVGRTEQHSSGGEMINPYPDEIPGWDYGVEMAFPFGYGLSYTTFQQDFKSLTYDAATDTFTATVTVTNTGATYTGKSVVELYVSPPYTDYDRQNLVERPAIQLVGWGKTDPLAPGESQDVSITVERYFLAVYDCNAAKTYILEPGDYWFAIGEDVHDALNNVISASNVATVKPLIDQNGTEVSGHADKAKKYTVEALDTETYATNSKGNSVTNLFEGDSATDVNQYAPGTVTYLTRGGGGNDWSTSFPEMVSVTLNDRMITLLNGLTYVTPAGKDDPSQVTLNQDAGLTLLDMVNVDADDPLWDTFVGQMNITELLSILDDYKGYSAVLEKIGRNKAIHHSDGPNGLEITYNVGEVRNATCYVSENLASSTWNTDLLCRRGELIGEECLYADCQVYWGPGVNLHRTPYSGRNFEYFSEDPILSLLSSQAVCSGAASKGALTGGKHMVANDQEVNRNGVSTFMTEQTLREAYLRPFEVLLRDNSLLYIMCSEGRLGLTSTSLNTALLTDLLRKEWDYKGIVISDAANDLEYMHPREGIAAGTNVWCLTKKYAQDIRKYLQTDAYLLEQIKESNKRVYFAYTRSNYMNGLTEEVAVVDWMPWWKPVVLAANVITAIGLVVTVTFFAIKTYGRKERKQ